MDSRESCLALIASIPTMQVENLEFSIYSGFQHVKAGIVQAVKRNGSLRNVYANKEYCLDWLDDGDSGKLISFTERNKLLVQWTENSTVVPKAAWSEYLVVAQTTGPNTVFSILRALAPSLGPFEGEQCRKRRRPDFYVPS
jgi:hypothetical protein